MSTTAPPITESIEHNVGSTPMLKLDQAPKGVVLAKLECANPTGSVKDRIAKQLLEERDNATNASNERATLIVPTSGNFGLAIAGLAAKRGNYRVVAVIPERTTNDRIQMLKALGAEIMRTPNEARPEAPESSYSVAARLAGQLKDAIVMDETQLQSAKYYKGLADEILQQTNKEFDNLFVTVESGVTISALASHIKKELPNVKVFGVEPVDSIFSDPSNHPALQLLGRMDWKLEDMGNNFVPKSLDPDVVDQWYKISDKEAFSMARRLIRDEGVMCGPSSGAVVAAAVRHAKEHGGRNVVILNDSAKNYTSTLLNNEWLLENDLADDLIMKELEYLSTDRYRAASVEDLQLPAAVTIPPSATVSHAIDIMLEREYSQLPVIRTDNRKLVGYVSLASLQDRLEHGSVNLVDPVEKCMFSFRKAGGATKYQVITPETSLSDLAKFFDKNSFAVITDANRKWCLGVATKYDLISFLHRRQFL
ncbi:hypothetical protein VTP01DRAFT_4724 [Rhizomucor pusillus]|uniref:uncharacterized protein n=1 Tax=Rhizomucor pusillus TaxID=4840 RepID=UPI0037447582